MFDILAGIDYIRGAYPDADINDMSAAGGSYGGYMVSWLNARTDGLFKSIVNHCGVYDTAAMAYSSDIQGFFDYHFMGPWYEDGTNVNRENPDNFCELMDVPTLVIHGTYDFRVPLAQGIGAFTCL